MLNSVVDFFNRKDIENIINVLIKYSDSKIYYVDYIKNDINTTSEYLNINNYEIEYWVDRYINLESDSDLLLDFIYRIPHNLEKNIKKDKNIQTIINKIIEKVEGNNNNNNNNNGK